MADTSDTDTIIASARAGEPDRYLAALLSPRAARDGLLALAAFSAELGQVARRAAREPMMGEVRLQWWRDALEPEVGDARTGNPIADALRQAQLRHALPTPLFVSMIDAHASDLQPDPFADDQALAVYLTGSEAAPFALAARILGAAPGPILDAASASAGLAYGLARLLLGVPRSLAEGRQRLPQARLARAGIAIPDMLTDSADILAIASLLAEFHAEARAHLVAARQHVADLPREVRAAFLPLALVEPYVHALERPGRDVLRQAPEIAPLRRILRIAGAHWFGRM